uniref:Uncharacterized protein n=1 Tax=Hanusia phi TaxID=3032 RepID=A0A7S0HFP8_9CRYP
MPSKSVPQKIDRKAKFLAAQTNFKTVQSKDPNDAVFGKAKIVIEAVVADENNKTELPESSDIVLEVNSKMILDIFDLNCLMKNETVFITVYRNGKIHSFNLPQALLMAPTLDPQAQVGHGQEGCVHVNVLFDGGLSMRFCQDTISGGNIEGSEGGMDPC